MELGKYLCEVRAGQYWRLENLKSFDEFLERRFPESRRKAYYLMSIHEHLPPQVRKELKQVGWTKGAGVGQAGAPAGPALRKCNLAAQSPTDAQGGVPAGGGEGADGKDSEPSELIYFKVYKSQIPVIEQAIETAALMLGSDKSRGYCLEMICADFLAGASMDGNNPEILLQSISRYYNSCPVHNRRPFFRGQPGSFMKKVAAKTPRLRLDSNSYRELHRQVLERDGWRCQVCGSMQHLQVHHLKFRSQSGGDEEELNHPVR